MDKQDQRSAPALIGDLMNNVNDLFRTEIQLLRAELGKKASQAATALGMIAGGAIAALVALIVLVFGLVAALENAGMAPGWAALIVGLGFAIVGFIMIGKGTRDLKASNLTPDRTAVSLSRDAKAVKEAVS